MNEMTRAVGRVEGKLDLLIEAIRSGQEKQTELAKQINWARGGLAAIGAAFSGTTIYSFLHMFK